MNESYKLFNLFTSVPNNPTNKTNKTTNSLYNYISLTHMHPNYYFQVKKWPLPRMRLASERPPSRLCDSARLYPLS